LRGRLTQKPLQQRGGTSEKPPLALSSCAYEMVLLAGEGRCGMPLYLACFLLSIELIVGRRGVRPQCGHVLERSPYAMAE